MDKMYEKVGNAKHGEKKIFQEMMQFKGKKNKKIRSLVLLSESTQKLIPGGL